MGGWLSHFFGLDNLSGAHYGFWSGVGSIVIPPILTSLPIVLVLLRKHNCHVHRCWRIGRHTATDADGQTHTVCRKHHPRGHLKAERLAK